MYSSREMCKTQRAHAKYLCEVNAVIFCIGDDIICDKCIDKMLNDLCLLG